MVRCKGCDPLLPTPAGWIPSSVSFSLSPFFPREDVRAGRFQFLTAPGLEKWNPAGKEKPFMNFKRWDTLCTEAYSLHWLWKEDNPHRLTERVSWATSRSTVVFQGNLELLNAVNIIKKNWVGGEVRKKHQESLKDYESLQRLHSCKLSDRSPNIQSPSPVKPQWIGRTV